MCVPSLLRLTNQNVYGDTFLYDTDTVTLYNFIPCSKISEMSVADASRVYRTHEGVEAGLRWEGY